MIVPGDKTFNQIVCFRKRLIVKELGIGGIFTVENFINTKNGYRFVLIQHIPAVVSFSYLICLS